MHIAFSGYGSRYLFYMNSNKIGKLRSNGHHFGLVVVHRNLYILFTVIIGIIIFFGNFD